MLSREDMRAKQDRIITLADEMLELLPSDMDHLPLHTIPQEVKDKLVETVEEMKAIYAALAGRKSPVVNSLGEFIAQGEVFIAEIKGYDHI